MSYFDMRSTGDSLSFFSLMFLRRSLAAELGDTIGRFIVKLKRVKRLGRPHLMVVLERKSPAGESLRVITKNLAPRIDNARKSLMGDSFFDKRFALVGANDLECAVFLGTGARKSLLGLCDDIEELDVAPEKTVVLFQGMKIVKSGKLGERVAGIIGFMDELATGMADDTANKGKIIGHIREESFPKVKTKMLKALLSFYAVDDEIAGLLEELLKDKSLEVSVVAASRLGKKGRDFLVKTLDTAPAGKANVAAFIIDAIIETDGEVPRSLLAGIASPGREPELSASIARLIRQQVEYHPPSFFRDLFNKHDDPAIRCALFEALVARRSTMTHSPAWDGFFIKHLYDVDRKVRLGAVHALGDTGSATCVEELVKVAASRRLDDERRAARAAVEKIQSRLEGAGSGWLSLTKPSEMEGSLSVAGGAEEGALSVEEEDV